MSPVALKMQAVPPLKAHRALAPRTIEAEQSRSRPLAAWEVEAAVAALRACARSAWRAGEPPAEAQAQALERVLPAADAGQVASLLCSWCGMGEPLDGSLRDAFAAALRRTGGGMSAGHVSAVLEAVCSAGWSVPLAGATEALAVPFAVALCGAEPAKAVRLMEGWSRLGGRFDGGLRGADAAALERMAVGDGGLWWIEAGQVADLLEAWNRAQWGMDGGSKARLGAALLWALPAASPPLVARLFVAWHELGGGWEGPLGEAVEAALLRTLPASSQPRHAVMGEAEAAAVLQAAQRAYTGPSAAAWNASGRLVLSLRGAAGCVRPEARTREVAYWQRLLGW